ncbi:MAG TPA: putative lipid II flippase FtsW [Actinomycetota bacterium]|nr:putative lipid II flippase FtsW [Actinomycetota bacterium]
MTVAQLAGANTLRRIRIRRARADVAPMTTTAALLVGSSGMLLAGGLMMILSASWVSAYQRYGSSFLFFQRQLMWTVGGLCAMYVFSRVDYRKLRGFGYLLLAGSYLGMIAVLIPGVGTTAGGSTRWLVFGPMRVQPSELAKLALVIVAADICTRKTPKRLRTIKDVMMPLGVIACLGAGLVMLQPDLGTTLIMGGIIYGVLFVAGTSGRTLSVLGVAGVGATILLSLSEGYRRARLLSFFNPFSDPLNNGYQAVQAQIALGSGGLFGVGLGASRQKWSYVPNAHTDFIFAIIGEELGLIGTFAVIGLFGLLCYAGVRAARRAPDVFGRILAGGITAWVGGQAVINMGTVTGLLPITGVPLPLVSFGGSSLVFTLAALGILINIARNERWPQRAARADATVPPDAQTQPRRRAVTR